MTIIGAGNKCRQGKDFVSEIIQQMLGNKRVIILHWADELYNEAKNKPRLFPLIRQKYNGGIKCYYLLNNPLSGDYDMFFATEMPELDKIFEKRGIGFYMGMESKDSEILQVWGTDYRRTHYGKDYWVNKTKEKIELMKDLRDDLIILIPDTRFKNEVEAVYSYGGLFVKVIRIKDGKQYIAPDRNPYHPSETELDNFPADYQIIANDGDIEGLRESAMNFLKHYNLIKQKEPVK